MNTTRPEGGVRSMAMPDVGVQNMVRPEGDNTV